MHTAQLHSCTNEREMYSFRVSLWGFDYSQPIIVTPVREGIQRIQLRKREGTIDLITLEVIYKESSITVRAPYQIMNKTPFTLYVMADTV